MKPKLNSIIALLALALGGCAAPALVDPTDSGRDTILSEEDAVSTVRLTTALATLETDVSDFGFKFRAQTGKVFREVFTGGEESPAVLDLVSATFSKSSSDFLQLIPNTQVFFTVSVALRAADGSKHVLSSTGAGSTKWTIDRAMREAVERAVLDLGRQVRALM